MGSLRITFDDEFQTQTTYRTKFVKLLKVMLDKDPDLFGTSITISCSKGKGNLVAGRPVNNYYKYKNDRFQNTPVNELGELADYLYSIDTFNPWSVVEWREIMSKEDDKDKDYYLSLGS